MVIFCIFLLYFLLIVICIVVYCAYTDFTCNSFEMTLLENEKNAKSLFHNYLPYLTIIIVVHV